jgi:hypothetical protein
MNTDLIIAFGDPSTNDFEIDFCHKSGVFHFKQATNPSVDHGTPTGGFGDAREYLEPCTELVEVSVLLPAPLRQRCSLPPMPTVFFTVHYFAAFHFEGYIFRGPNKIFLPRITRIIFSDNSCNSWQWV